MVPTGWGGDRDRLTQPHARSLPRRRRCAISERCSRVRFPFVIKGFLPSRYGQRGQPLRSQSRTKLLCPPMQSMQLARIAFRGEVIGFAGSWSDFIFHLPGDAMLPTWRPNLLYQKLGRLAASSSCWVSLKGSGFWIHESPLSYINEPRPGLI